MIAAQALEVCHSRNITDWATIKSDDQGRPVQLPLQENQAQPHDPAGHHGSVNESPRWS